MDAASDGPAAPLRVDELLLQPAFVEKPLPDSSGSRAEKRKSDTLDWSQISLTVERWEGFVTGASKLELTHPEAQINQVQGSNLGDASFEMIWKIRHRNGVTSGGSETSWRLGMSGQITFHGFANIAAAMGLELHQNVKSKSHSTTDAEGLSGPARVQAENRSNPSYELRTTATRLRDPNGAADTTAEHRDIETFLRHALQISLIPDAVCQDVRQDVCRQLAHQCTSSGESSPAADEDGTVLCMELKHNKTLGLLPQGMTEHTREAVEEVLQGFPDKCNQHEVYGALTQALAQMLATGATVALLFDGATYIFLHIGSTLSSSGEAVERAQWRLSHYVACFDDASEERPSVFKCFAYALKVAKEAPSSKHAISWRKLRKQLIAGGSRAGQSGSKQRAGPSGTTAPSAERGPATDGATGGVQLAGAALRLDLGLLGFLVGEGRYSQVWRYATNRVIKCVAQSKPHAFACMEREIHAYHQAKKLQGVYLPTLHEHGSVGQSIGVLVLDFLRSAVPSSSLREAAADVWSAFRALWGEGVLHGDVHAGNIRIQPSQEPGKQFDVKIIDLGLAQTFDGPVPQHLRVKDETKLHQLVGPPTQ